MKLEPLLVEKPWGGSWLTKLYGSQSKSKIGEAWLLSTLEEGESIANGRPLSETLGGKLPFVVKIIDAQNNLSIQVHPNNEWALKLEGSLGKTECWLVLDAKPGAGVFLGLRDGVTGASFADAVFAGLEVENLVQFFPVQRGDFITVPAGTIHAIGAGVVLLEVQQASGITYRLWDWGRPGRELHLDKGMKVASFENQFTVQPQIFESMQSGVLFKHADFECDFNSSAGEGWFVDLKTFEVYCGSQARSTPYLFIA